MQDLFIPINTNEQYIDIKYHVIIGYTTKECTISSVERIYDEKDFEKNQIELQNLLVYVGMAVHNITSGFADIYPCGRYIKKDETFKDTTYNILKRHKLIPNNKNVVHVAYVYIVRTYDNGENYNSIDPIAINYKVHEITVNGLTISE